ncbi:hypothetical protein [Rhodospirillum sp. A1_3_36]|uniref:hypothetical protein n=1 Tax=Rhodospirillum sp. A1_3_36 TaxID=3391666 RepID=UPI0039A6A5CC
MSDRWIDPEVEEIIRACVDQLLGQKAEGTVVPFPMDRIGHPDRVGLRLRHRRAGPLGPRLVQ